MFSEVTCRHAHLQAARAQAQLRCGGGRQQRLMTAAGSGQQAVSRAATRLSIYGRYSMREHGFISTVNFHNFLGHSVIRSNEQQGRWCDTVSRRHRALDNWYGTTVSLLLGVVAPYFWGARVHHRSLHGAPRYKHSLMLRRLGRQLTCVPRHQR